ncbi:MAG TPA: recombinase family protein [Conexibacter sp.]|nr:recombinase family protein [Conexibacter sp.]
MRRTSQPRFTHRRTGSKHSAPRRRTGGSSPTTRTAPRARSSTGRATQAALDLARRGGADLLLVYRVDRLSRKVRQLAQLAEELDRLNVVLRSATEPFDTGSAAGRMMLQMLGVFAEFEHATIVDRVTAGIERRAKQGYWPNGRVPYGYRRNDAKELVEEEREAPIVRRIFDLYTAGRHGAVSIARLLDAEHAPARSGQGWQPAVVLLILRNEAYVGRVHWRGQVFDGKHAGLVDEATFERAQKLLKERGEDCAQRVGQRSDFLLSGLLRCGRCRRAYVGMSARGNGGLYHYYACSGRQKRGPKACDGDRIPREKLEDAVIEQLAGIYRDGHLIRQAIEQAAEGEHDERDVLEDRRASIAAEIKRAERAIDRYLDAFENGDLDAKRFQGRMAALEAKLDGLKDQDQQLAHELAAEAPHAPDTAELHATANALEDAIRAGNPNTPKRSCASSSPSCASTPAPRSFPPTGSSRPWFARRPVQWAILGSNQ